MAPKMVKYNPGSVQKIETLALSNGCNLWECLHFDHKLDDRGTTNDAQHTGATPRCALAVVQAVRLRLVDAAVLDAALDGIFGAAQAGSAHERMRSSPGYLGKEEP